MYRKLPYKLLPTFFLPVLVPVFSVKTFLKWLEIHECLLYLFRSGALKAKCLNSMSRQMVIFT